MSRLPDRDEDALPLSRVQPVDEDVRRELEFHLERRAAELVAQGYTTEGARAAARELFGDRSGVEAECRAIESRRRANHRRARRWEAFRQDAVVGIRMLGRSPAFTIAALSTLELGSGATTAVFAIVDQVLLRPLPYHQPERLVDMVELHENGGSGSVPWENLLDIEKSARSFVALAAHGSGQGTVLGVDQPLRTEIGWVSKDFFRVFPVVPFLGRLPLPDEHRIGAYPVAVVSHAFWRDHLGAPKSLAGVRLKMSLDHEVVGVLPPGFDFPGGTEVWRPIELNQESTSRTSHNWNVTGRLAPGVTVEAATREVDELLQRLKTQYYPDFDAVGARITPLQALMTQGARTPLYLLMGAAALVLITACSNLAGAMLARGTARAGELAVRSALGATRTRLVRQLLTESVLLAIGGGVAGVVLAMVLLRTFGALAPGSVPVADVAIDGRVMAFAMGIVVLTAVLFGLVPALRLSDGGQASSMLREGGRGTADVGRLRAWKILVAGEVALAVVLVTGSALLIQSYARVLDARLGFDPAEVTVAEVNLPAMNYGDGDARTADFHRRTLETLQANRDIDAAGFGNVPPLGGNFMSGALEVEGKPRDARGEFNAYALYRVVGGDFFRAAGIPLIRGRTFGSGDDRDAPPVVVINETFARTEWPGQDPIGRRVRVSGMDGIPDEPWFVVIGVVGDVRSGSPIDRFRQTYYFDHRQRPSHRSRSVTYIARSSQPATSVSGALRAAITASDPDVPIEIRAMRALLTDAVSDRRFTMVVLAAFATVALFLAVIGIFAVVSYSVAQRTREIGVRLALGSTPRGVRRMVVLDAMRAVAPGLMLGGILSIASAGTLRTLLYDVSPVDPLAIGAAIVILALAAVGSSLIPAIRSTRIDPMLAIRGE